MIEERLFANMRQRRQKNYQMEPGSIAAVQDISSLFPAVGGS